MQWWGRVTVRCLLPVKGGEGAYCASTALPSAEGRRGDLKAQALAGSSVHPLAPRNGEAATLLWPRQTERQRCFVFSAGKRGDAGGQTLPQKAPLWAVPSPCPWGSELPELASGWRAEPALGSCWPGGGRLRHRDRANLLGWRWWVNGSFLCWGQR